MRLIRVELEPQLVVFQFFSQVSICDFGKGVLLFLKFTDQFIQPDLAPIELAFRSIDKVVVDSIDGSDFKGERTSGGANV